MQLERQAAVPLFVGHLEHIDLRYRAGDVEQGIDPAERGQRLLDDFGCRRSLGKVEIDDQRLGPRRLHGRRRLLEILAPAGGERDRGKILFIADAPALDFLNSVATPAEFEVDWIDDGEGFLDWLAQAQLVQPDILKALRAKAAPAAFDHVAAEARSLREWFGKFVRSRKGRPLVAKDLQKLEPLNRLIARDERFSQVAVRQADAGEPVLELRMMRHWRSPEALLLPIGEVLSKFVCEEDFSNVKACEGPACTLIFADHTRGRMRRGCSMAICGNRAKQAAHRDRLRH
jgi:predicted RNA-binding Zn ribbon-like protein